MNKDGLSGRARIQWDIQYFLIQTPRHALASTDWTEFECSETASRLGQMKGTN